jgi:hypothetical protein
MKRTKRYTTFHLPRLEPRRTSPLKSGATRQNRCNRRVPAGKTVRLVYSTFPFYRNVKKLSSNNFGKLEKIKNL